MSLGVTAFSSRRRFGTRLDAGGTVEPRLAARSDFRRAVFIILTLLVFPLVTGGDFLCRIFTIIHVQDELFWLRLGAVLVHRDEVTGAGVLGDHRRAYHEVMLHRRQLGAGFQPKCGQLG